MLKNLSYKETSSCGFHRCIATNDVVRAAQPHDAIRLVYSQMVKSCQIPICLNSLSATNPRFFECHSHSEHWVTGQKEQQDQPILNH